MSYILEALKESQRSRDEQRVPDIMTVHAAPEVEHKKSGRAPLVWVILLLVLMASAAGWWYAGQRSQRPPMIAEVAEQEAIISSPQVSQEISSPVGQVENEVAQEASLPPSPVIQQMAPEVEENLVEQVAPAAEDTPAVEAAVSLPQPSIPQPVVVVEKTQPATVQAASADSAVAAKQVEMPADSVTAVDAVVGKVSVDAIEPETANAKPAVTPVVTLPADISSDTEAVPESPEPERIPHYRELPYDVQQAVAGVKYSVHLYSPNPERRMVKINGIVRREGSEVSPGLVLEQVTPDGAIFTYREYRFRMPVR